MKKLTIQSLTLWVKNMKNDSFKKHTHRKHFATLVILLLLSSACSLFSGSWDDGIELKEKGEASLAEKKYDESIEAFSKALAIIENIDDRGNKGHAETLAQIYKFRGTAYINVKNYDRSLEDFNKSIQIKRSGPETAYIERGNLFLLKKDYEKALADFEEVVPDINDYRAPLGMAIVYYETQKYEKADEFISSALRDLSSSLSEKRPYYDPNDHIKAYEYAIKLSEQKGDMKNAELEKESLQSLKKKHDKN